MGKNLRVMVTKRKDACDRVLGALAVQGTEIGGEMETYLEPVLGSDESLPDVSSLLLLCGRRLEGYCNAMVAADQAHLAELARLESLRDQAMEPMRGLKDSILSLRATCQGLFGRASLSALGLDFNIARNPAGVLRQAEIVRSRLANGALTIAAKPWIRGTFDRHSALAELDRDIEPLRDTLTRQIEQRKRIDTAKVRKDLAIQEFDRHFIRITRLIESTFRVAGETELADRIRPAARRLGRESASDSVAPSESETKDIEARESQETEATPRLAESSDAASPHSAEASRSARQPHGSEPIPMSTEPAPTKLRQNGYQSGNNYRRTVKPDAPTDRAGVPQRVSRRHKPATRCPVVRRESSRCSKARAA